MEIPETRYDEYFAEREKKAYERDWPDRKELKIQDLKDSIIKMKVARMNILYYVIRNKKHLTNYVKKFYQAEEDDKKVWDTLQLLIKELDIMGDCFTWTIEESIDKEKGWYWDILKTNEKRMLANSIPGPWWHQL